MISATEILTLKQEVWLQANIQPAFAAKITEIDNNLFWVNLPKEGHQVMVLLKDQPLKVGISYPKGFYHAETTVGALGHQSNRFYGLVIPHAFEESQERRFTRAHHYTNVFLTSGQEQVQTALVNFSAGGMMVYLVPSLEKMLQSGQNIRANWTIEDFPFELDVELAWRKNYDNIPFAGFSFRNITPRMQGALSMLSIRYTDKKE